MMKHIKTILFCNVLLFSLDLLAQNIPVQQPITEPESSYCQSLLKTLEAIFKNPEKIIEIFNSLPADLKKSIRYLIISGSSFLLESKELEVSLLRLLNLQSILKNCPKTQEKIAQLFIKNIEDNKKAFAIEWYNSIKKKKISLDQALEEKIRDQESPNYPNVQQNAKLLVTTLIKAGADPNQLNDHEPLIITAVKSYINSGNMISATRLDQLLGHSINLNAQDAQGNTALMYASANARYADKGFYALIKEANLGRLDVNIKNNNGENALLYMIRNSKTYEHRQEYFADELIKAGINIFEKDNNGINAVDEAQRQNKEELLKVFQNYKQAMPAQQFFQPESLYCQSFFKTIETILKNPENKALLDSLPTEIRDPITQLIQDPSIGLVRLLSNRIGTLTDCPVTKTKIARLLKPKADRIASIIYTIASKNNLNLNQMLLKELNDQEAGRILFSFSNYKEDHPDSNQTEENNYRKLQVSKIIQYILDAGIDFNQKIGDQQDPLIIHIIKFAQKNRYDSYKLSTAYLIISQLQKYNFDINVTDNEGSTALMLIAADPIRNPSTFSTIVFDKIMLYKNININQKNNKGENALLYMLRNSKATNDEKLDIAKKLLNKVGNNLDIFAPDNNGKNALDEAVKQNNKELFELFKKHIELVRKNTTPQ